MLTQLTLLTKMLELHLQLEFTIYHIAFLWKFANICQRMDSEALFFLSFCLVFLLYFFILYMSKYLSYSQEMNTRIIKNIIS